MAIFVDKARQVKLGEACAVESDSGRFEGIVHELTVDYVIIALDPKDPKNSLKQRIFYFKKDDWIISKL